MEALVIALDTFLAFKFQFEVYGIVCIVYDRVLAVSSIFGVSLLILNESFLAQFKVYGSVWQLVEDNSMLLIYNCTNIDSRRSSVFLVALDRKPKASQSTLYRVELGNVV